MHPGGVGVDRRRKERDRAAASVDVASLSNGVGIDNMDRQTALDQRRGFGVGPRNEYGKLTLG